jgi:hypothetical protein
MNSTLLNGNIPQIGPKTGYKLSFWPRMLDIKYPAIEFNGERFKQNDWEI